MTKCWICGGIANSKEHKFKASDIKRTYGKKFDGYYIQEKPIQISSYKDKLLKFPEIICEYCNVTRTRPHDDAYDEFVKYCLNNYDLLLKSKKLDFKKIYDSEWLEQKRNLYRYFSKHAGCKVYTSEHPQDLTDLAEFIMGADMLQNFALYFELKMIIQVVHSFYNRTQKYSHLFNGPTIYYGHYQNLTLGGWISNNWITTNWVYSRNINPNKKPDFTDSQENLSVINLDYYDKSLMQSETYDGMISHFEYGQLTTLEKRIEHYEKIIT